MSCLRGRESMRHARAHEEGDNSARGRCPLESSGNEEKAARRIGGRPNRRDMALAEREERPFDSKANRRATSQRLVNRNRGDWAYWKKRVMRAAAPNVAV